MFKKRYGVLILLLLQCFFWFTCGGTYADQPGARQLEKFEKQVADLERSVNDLKKQVVEDDKGIRANAQKATDWAVWTLRLIAGVAGLLGVLDLLITVGSIFGFYSLREIRDSAKSAVDEAKAGVAIKMQLEDAAKNLTKVFREYYERIDFTELAKKVTKPSPIERALFEYHDTMLMLAPFLGFRQIKPQDYIVLGRFYRWINEYGKALLRLNKALELDPNFPDALIYKSHVLAMLAREEQTPDNKLKLQEESLHCANKALEKEPSNVYGNLAKAYILDEMGRFEESVASNKRCLEIDPSFYLASYNMACSMCQSGKVKEAWGILQTLKGRQDIIQDVRNDQDRELKNLKEHATLGKKFKDEWLSD